MYDILYRIICIIIGYIFGLFQTGYLYGKMNHIDIRDYGSGNAGTTNAMRVLGKKAGVITYIGDTLKGVLCGILIRIIFSTCIGLDGAYIFVLVLYGGLGVVLGHNFPFYMNFKGGKGIAASSGVIISLLDIRLMIIACVTFVLVAVLSRYVSLASITMMIVFFISIVIFGFAGWLPVSKTSHFIETIIMAFLLSALAIVRHKANIGRLINGTERKIGEKKDNKENK